MSKKNIPAIVSGMGLGASIINALCAEMYAAGGTDEEIHRLSTEDGRTTLREMAKLAVSVNKSDLIVDLDADPFCPDGWAVMRHQKGGKRKFDRNTIGLYLADGQKNGSRMVGTDLRDALVSQPVENANQLDWYLAHPDQIPEEWKGKFIFFWGTIYRNADGKLCVRCLHWLGGRWDWYYDWLGSGFDSDNPAAVRK